MFELAHVKRQMFKTSTDIKASFLPKAWESAVMRRACYSSNDAALSGFLQRFAAIPHERQGIFVGMTDGAINELAKDCAVRCEEFCNLYRDKTLIREACARLAVAKGAPPIVGKFDDAGAVARYLDAAAWRRILRTAYNKLAESMAVQLGVVHARNNLYVTNESVNRRIAQNDRNARALNDTYLENENGQVFSLAELAALSTSNKSIKRSELMIRLAGFDLYAQKVGHVGDFVTLTCPSRMHAVHRKSGAFNENHDKTNPKQANDYLCKLWAKVRAVWAKKGVQVYGFRMAEPHHDACPHWHMVLFFQADARRLVRRTLIRYGLKDNGSEPGAWKNRVKIKAVDFKKGGASAYLAKYIAKNIDGYKVGKDLLGNDALTSSQRVEAWATTWKIRQFQQIGGAPVGVWRALRKVKNLSIDAPAALRSAWRAVNYKNDSEIDKGKYGWRQYTEAMGGAVTEQTRNDITKKYWNSYDKVKLIKQRPVGGKRGQKWDIVGEKIIPTKTYVLTSYTKAARPIALHKVWFDTVGKYGDAAGDKVRGVACNDMVFQGTYYEWKPASAQALQKKGIETTAARSTPWIHVSNCNRGFSSGEWLGQGGGDFDTIEREKSRLDFARRSRMRQREEKDYINDSDFRRKLAA